MMIKFRGKRIDSGEWVYGAFVPDELEQTHGKMVTWGFIRRYKPNRTVESVEMIEVDRNTVGQYTGLKDKNGTEIYEGDICKYSYINPMTREERTFVCKVEWSNGAYWLRSIDDSSQDTLLWIQHKEIEVIGNIYENPELLKKEA